MVSVLQACNTDTTQTQPHQIANAQRTENKTIDVVIQQHRRKLLMMNILMSETCSAHKKWNKIIHPSTPRSPQWSLSFWFPHQDPIYSPLLTHTRHMPSPSHSSWFYHPHDIGWAVQIINFLSYTTDIYSLMMAVLCSWNMLLRYTVATVKLCIVYLLNHASLW